MQTPILMFLQRYINIGVSLGTFIKYNKISQLIHTQSVAD